MTHVDRIVARKKRLHSVVTKKCYAKKNNGNQFYVSLLEHNKVNSFLRIRTHIRKYWCIYQNSSTLCDKKNDDVLFAS